MFSINYCWKFHICMYLSSLDSHLILIWCLAGIHRETSHLLTWLIPQSGELSLCLEVFFHPLILIDEDDWIYPVIKGYSSIVSSFLVKGLWCAWLLWFHCYFQRERLVIIKHTGLQFVFEQLFVSLNAI